MHSTHVTRGVTMSKGSDCAMLLVNHKKKYSLTDACIKRKREKEKEKEKFMIERRNDKSKAIHDSRGEK